jgi:hypothetical protein
MTAGKIMAAATLVAATVGCTAPASAKLKKRRFDQNAQVCMDLGMRTPTHTAYVSELPSNIKPFGNLTASVNLMLTIRGKYKFYTRHDTNNKPLYAEGFFPNRFALEGSGTATVEKHPRKRGPLLSQTVATVHSTKTGVDWSFGASVSPEGPGLGISATPTKSEHTEGITGTGSTPRGKSVNSFVAEGGNAVSGAAGKASGLDRITVQGFVIVGHDRYKQRTEQQSWAVKDHWESPHYGEEIDGLEPCDPAINFNP